MKKSIVDNEQNLEFDDELEDFDDLRHTRPRRRWFIMGLLLILAAGGLWYVVTNPELRASITGMLPDTVRTTFDVRTEDPAPRPDRNVSSPSNVPPVPAFHEGQRVAVAHQEDRQARFRLRTEAEGDPLGPLVKTGDVLTVVDGSLIRKQWMYFVQTQSGASGWIREMDLHPQS